MTSKFLCYIIITIISLLSLLSPVLSTRLSSSSSSSVVFLQTKTKTKTKLKTKTNIENPYDISNEDVVYYANGPCNAGNCDKCVTATRCQCPNGYAQDPDKEVSAKEKSCQYKRKKQWAFFLLEMIFPFGIGHFYAKRIVYGIIKMIVFILILVSDFIVKHLLIKQFKSKQNFNNAMIGLYFGYITWHLIDLIMIGINEFQDGKKIDLTFMH